MFRASKIFVAGKALFCLFSFYLFLCWFYGVVTSNRWTVEILHMIFPGFCLFVCLFVRLYRFDIVMLSTVGDLKYSMWSSRRVPTEQPTIRRGEIQLRLGGGKDISPLSFTTWKYISKYTENYTGKYITSVIHYLRIPTTPPLDISESICSEGLYFTADSRKRPPNRNLRMSLPPLQEDGLNRLDKYIESEIQFR